MLNNRIELGESMRARVERIEGQIKAVCELCKDSGEALAYALNRGRAIAESISTLRTLARRLEAMGEFQRARALREVANDLAGSLNYAIKHNRGQAGAGFAWIGPRAG